MEYTKLLYICDCFVRAWVHKSAVFMSFIPLYRCTVVFYCRTVVTYSATVFTATYWMKPKYWVIYRSVIKVDSIPLYYHPRTAFTGLGPGASFNWTVYHYTYCYTNIPKSTLPRYILSSPAYTWTLDRKVRQYVVNREWGNIRAGRRRNHFPFHVWLAQNWIGQRDYLAADVCKKIAHSPRKLLTKFAHNEQIYCEQKFAQ